MRTKTYIAADFDHDKDAVDILYTWKKSNLLSFDFQDAHELTQSRDTSLPCSVKKSLRYRLSESRTFVLIVGKHTDTLTKGGCHLCPSYNSHISYCVKGNSVDNRSYIHYECEIAKQDFSSSYLTKVVILYKSTSVDKSLCPQVLRNVGIHIPMILKNDGQLFFDYQKIKEVLG